MTKIISNIKLHKILLIASTIIVGLLLIISAAITPTRPIQKAESANNYGEVRITNTDGSTLVIGGDYSGNNGFKSGSTINIYVVIENQANEETGVPATFKNKSNDWNYMLSKVLINGISTEPNKRIKELIYEKNIL